MTARTYQLSPIDRTGVLLGLSSWQTSCVGASVVAFAVTASQVSFLAGVIVAALPAACAVRVHGSTAIDVVPLVWSRLQLGWSGRTRWLAPLPNGATTSELPLLQSQQVIPVEGTAHDFPGRAAPIAVVHDTATGRLAATIRVEGPPFALFDTEDQDRLLRSWGEAIDPLARPGSSVVAIRWSDWTAPVGLDDQVAWLEDHQHEDADPAEVEAYRALLDANASATWSREALVTIVVADRTVRRGRRGRQPAAGAVVALLTETRQLARRLEGLGFAVDGPLSPAELALAVRVRLDPSCRRMLARRQRTLGERAGVTTTLVGPLAVEQTWRSWRADGSIHRGFYVADWPHLPVTASWMQQLSLSGGLTRTIAVCCEPVAPASSRRSVTRDVTKLMTDADQRSRAGFRVGGAHGRAEQAVLDREQELVAGFAEFTYVATIDLSASSAEELDLASEELIQIAAGAGIEVRPLHGRHDDAVLVGLPFARTVAAKGLLP